MATAAILNATFTCTNTLPHCAGGLPDLLLWRPDDHIARVVEVKGPRDRLSNQQRFWLAHMAASTIDVEVCKVREPRQ
jgi:fanconi-associated nuclease 1